MEENQEEHMPLKNKLTSKRRCRVAKTKVTKNEIVCQYWISGTCKFGDKCKYMHSWSVGDAISLMTRLEGHQKGAQMGQSGFGTVILGSEGPWVFIGIPGYVKAWNLKTSTELTLSGPVGQVYSIASTDNLLLAGAQGSRNSLNQFISSSFPYTPIFRFGTLEPSNVNSA
ncbi:Zinc finger CCCH domain-containing protein 48 [Acorus gramineus]|uniref:Zinc finger CCCH domain-containing protein 48 n=1 Tax=Acorus gramineus TaxID=55184 RepID=A0AAV9AC97_ACOGR|nr:Zinc finger CCCH domain-containing protein 48 [Acorus gramineus]